MLYICNAIHHLIILKQANKQQLANGYAYITEPINNLHALCLALIVNPDKVDFLIFTFLNKEKTSA